MAPVLRQTLAQQAPAVQSQPSPYDLAMAELMKPPSQIPPAFTPEEIDARRERNDQLVQAGLLGVLSQDKNINNLGGAVFKQALAGRDPQVTAKGVLDPISGVFKENPDAVGEREEKRRDRVLQLALGYSGQRQKAQEAREAQEDRVRAREDSMRLAAALRQGARADADGLKADLTRARIEALEGQNRARDEKAAAAKEKAGYQLDHTIRRADFLTGQLERAKGLVGMTTTGVIGSQMRKVPGTDAYDLNKLVDTIKANIGFDELQQMRRESPTGGALGQVAIRELDMLQATLGNLDTAQDSDTFLQNVDMILTHFNNIKEISQRAKSSLEVSSGPGAQVPAAVPGPAPARPVPGAVPPVAPVQPGERTAVNPQTKQRLVLRNGQWVPVP